MYNWCIFECTIRTVNYTITVYSVPYMHHTSSPAVNGSSDLEGTIESAVRLDEIRDTSARGISTTAVSCCSMSVGRAKPPSEGRTAVRGLKNCHRIPCRRLFYINNETLE